MGAVAWGQTQTRHPRVLEVEKAITGEAQAVMRDFLNGQSFSVSVRIEPLHRSTVSNGKKENLPFYEASEEIRDEWDDPNKTDFELMQRVVRLTVKAAIPKSLPDAQVADLKVALANRLALTEGRDTVEFDRKDWGDNNHDGYTIWILAIGFALLTALGVMHFLVSGFAVSKVTKAIHNIKINPSESSGSAPMNFAPAQVPTRESSDSVGTKQLQLNDTIKMTEVVLTLIENLKNEPAFPTLEDMVMIESYLDKSPSAIGALLAEFPMDIRKRLFSFSFSETWLEALSNPGEIGPTSFELVNRMSKNSRMDAKKEWEQLLLSCWRLDGQLARFLKALPLADAMVILKSLPQNISLKVAREIFPGEWAVLLRKGMNREVLNATAIQKYTSMAQEMLSLRSIDALDTYKRDLDLIKYLRSVEPTIEKEVYGALGEESHLEKLRPPFFPVLEAQANQIEKFVQSVSLEDWAWALMNIPKNQRENIESHFSDKQRIRFIELIKRFDKTSSLGDSTAEARDKIAKAFSIQEVA
jgi:hypothetical protein